MGRVVLRLPSSYGDGTAAAGQARRVRSNHGMYPQCVLANAKQLVASPFLVNISGAAPPLLSASEEPDTQHAPAPPPAKGVALTPPMGFNSWK